MMLILPNKAECYLSKQDIGLFRAFLPTTGIVTAESDNFYQFNGTCYANETQDATYVGNGQVFDGYFQCDNNLRVFVGGGNVPTATIEEDLWKRRVEIYTQTQLDICKEEFPLLYPAPVPPEPPVTPEPEPEPAEEAAVGVLIGRLWLMSAATLALMVAQ